MGNAPSEDFRRSGSGRFVAVEAIERLTARAAAVELPVVQFRGKSDGR